MAIHYTLTPQDDPAISVAVGITVGLIASLVQSLGLTIQRKSHVLNQAQPEARQEPDYRRPLWLLGFGVFITSNIMGSIFQIASLPVVILAPLGAVSLLWNAFFARVILGDVFSKYMILGTLLVIVGAVLVGIYGIVPEPAHSLDDLLRLFERTSFAIYFSLLGAAVLIILSITHISEWKYNRDNIVLGSRPDSPVQSVPPLHPSEELPSSEESPLLGAGKPRRSPSPILDASRTPTVLAISYASMSGILSGMCLIFAKSGVELLVLTAAGNNQFNRWQSWALIIALGVFALLQLWYLHKSLTLEDPTLVCPLAFCFYNLSSIMNGLIYFDQFDRLSNKQLGLVITGIVLLLFGVWAVSTQEDGEDEVGGVLEGDWIAAGAAANVETPPINPPLHHRAATSAASVPNKHFSLGGDRLIPPSRRATEYSTSSRRVASSPSAFFMNDNITEDPIEDDDEQRVGFGLPQEPLTSSEPSIARPVTRMRTLSGGSIRATSYQSLSSPPSHIHSPLSPRRRRTSARRGTLLSPGNGGNNAGGAEGDTVAAALGGFSIGLSPISPGFSLVPRHRTVREPSNTNTESESESARPRPIGALRWSRLRSLIGLKARPTQ